MAKVTQESASNFVTQIMKIIQITHTLLHDRIYDILRSFCIVTFFVARSQPLVFSNGKQNILNFL